VEGKESILDLADEVLEVVRTVMFCVGTPTLADLRRMPRLVGPEQSRLDTFTGSLSYASSSRGEFIDITGDVSDLVWRSGVRNGIVHVHSWHTTAAIRVNENEPLLMDDFRRMLDRLAPPGGYEHDDMERRVGVPPDEPRNGHSHCQHLLLSSSESLPVQERQLLLGPWQRVFLIELDSPRQRQVTVQVAGM